MSWRIWRLRQFACIDVHGKVVDCRPKDGISDAEVVGWQPVGTHRATRSAGSRSRSPASRTRPQQLFVQAVRGFFRFGLEQKPPCVVGDPTVGLKARKRSEEPADPSAEVTFTPEQTLGSVDWPASPFLDELMKKRVAEARRLHAKREATLRRRLARYRSEKAKQHLVKKTEVDLHAHTSSAPKLFTSPTGAPVTGPTSGPVW